MTYPVEKTSSDLFLRSDVGPEKTLGSRASEEVEITGKTPSFAQLETLERFVFAANCPPFSLIALEAEGGGDRAEALIRHLEKLEDPKGLLVAYQKKNRFLILVRERDFVSAETLVRSIVETFEEISFYAGVFSHPLEGFSSGSSLWNAQKALQHSRLTGPDTIVPFDAVSLNISGDTAWQEGNLREAIREYEAALKLDPNNTNVLNSLGVCFAAKGQLDQALFFFRKSSEADPSEVMPIYNEGLTYEMKGEEDKALEAFARAMALDPETFEAFFHAGKIYMDSGEIKTACSLFEKALMLRSGHGPALALFAESLLLLEDFEKAFHYFRKAQQRMPQNPQVLSGLGFCFFKKNEGLDIAATFCEEALALEPDNPLFALRLARILKKQGKEETAFPLLIRAQNAGMVLSENEKKFLQGIEASGA